MILGIDVGTQLLGYTILDDAGKIVCNEVVDLRKKHLKPFFKKAEQVKMVLSSLKTKYQIDKVFIEQSLNAFRPGLSSASVILTIGKFNGIVSWLCYEIFNKEPEYIGATTARKALNIKVERGQNAKEVVLKEVLAIEPTFQVSYTPHGNPVAGVYDRADSYVIAKAGYLSLKK